MWKLVKFSQSGGVRVQKVCVRVSAHLRVLMGARPVSDAQKKLLWCARSRPRFRFKVRVLSLFLRLPTLSSRAPVVGVTAGLKFVGPSFLLRGLAGGALSLRLIALAAGVVLASHGIGSFLVMMVANGDGLPPSARIRSSDLSLAF